MQKSHTRRGFTLIEVLIVVLIVAILSAIAVPQYQKAVLKSRFSSLMPTTKSIADGQEMYYMTNGHYADAISKLDVTATNNDDMTLTVSDDLDYAYTMATRPNIKNNLIMYQKHSLNFPGEIHCEALDGNTQAEWLCTTALHAVKELGEGITPDYKEYVIEGSGMGLTSTQAEAAKNCATAYAAGATLCNVNENPSTNGKTKQVCYSLKGMDDYCITTEFNEDNQQTKRTVCTSSQCSEYEYNENGNQTSRKICYSSSMSNDKKSCDKYDEIYDFDYDSTTGHRTSQKVCYSYSGMNSDRKSCNKYSSIYDFDYDPITGNRTFDRYCTNAVKCTRYSSVYEYKYDTITGNLTSKKECQSSGLTSDTKFCNSYTRIYDYSYDLATGNQKSYKYCYATSTAQSGDGETCNKYQEIYEYGYDSVTGNKTSEKYCRGTNATYSSNGKTCDKYETIYEYGYDESGNQTYRKSCKTYNADRTDCEAWNEPAYSYPVTTN